MCGISGIYAKNSQAIHRAEITRQIETLVHRGPDQGGVFLSEQQRCGLGIRRLSIIDVSGGNQPLRNEGGSIHLVYNGETYNHLAIRRELEQLGHRPKSHSDGEVIIHGYETWGAGAILRKIRGMFAFALWDENQQQLLLARDQFGIKPLYYAEFGGRLYFASEIKAILAHPDVPRRVNLPALEAMFKLGFVPGPATMFEEIYKLPPAHYLIAKDGYLTIKNYWQLDYQEDQKISIGEATEQFMMLLRESVQLRLMSEVPLGALLSGGLDSGTLVALLQSNLSLLAAKGSRQSPFDISPHGRLKTISIGFEHVTYDEASLASSLAQTIGTEHHPITCTAADFANYPTIINHLEEPQASASSVPIYKLYQACRQAGLTVILTGEGSDELLGGYHWHKGDALVRPMLYLPAALRKALAVSPLPMSAAARRVLTRGTGDVVSRYQDWLELEGGNYLHKLLTPEVHNTLQDNAANPLVSNWSDKLTNLRTTTPLHQTLWVESQTRMVDFINFEVDRMSMAHSIEARVPYLDHKLWEFCASLPARYKLKGRVEKYLLRRATKNILPEATRKRRKKGLASPYGYWLQQEPLPEWAETVLSDEYLRQAGLFDPKTVHTLLRAHRASYPTKYNQTNLAPLLMGVLSTQIWFERFIK